jgi:hypothetical protein
MKPLMAFEDENWRLKEMDAEQPLKSHPRDKALKKQWSSFGPLYTNPRVATEPDIHSTKITLDAKFLQFVTATYN